MNKLLLVAIPVVVLVAFATWKPVFPPSITLNDDACIDCHEDSSPGLVADWRASKHYLEDVSCSDCHGGKHTTVEDSDEARLPTPDTCADCHDDRVEEFKKGKHALAWAAMKAMPTIHWQPIGMIEGQKGCAGCHKIGL